MTDMDPTGRSRSDIPLRVKRSDGPTNVATSNGSRPAENAGASNGRVPARRPTDWTARVPTVFSVILGALSIVCALAAVSEAAFARSQPIREGINDVLLPAPPNLAYAAFVGILAASLARRKRLAYRVLLAYFAIQFVADLGVLALLGTVANFAHHVPGLSRAPWYAASSTAANLAIVSVALLILWISRAQFSARVQPASARKAATVLVAGIVGFSLGGWALVTAFPGTLKRGDTFVYTVEKVL